MRRNNVTLIYSIKEQLNYSCASSLSKAVIAKSAETFYLSLVVNLNSVPIK